MIQYITQAPIEAQAKASVWLRQFEYNPPDQSIQLIGSPDESYRPSVDEFLDSGSEDDEGSTMASSTHTKVTAGFKNADRYRKQMLRNGICEAPGPLMEKFYDFIAIFRDQVSSSEWYSSICGRPFCVRLMRKIKGFRGNSREERSACDSYRPADRLEEGDRGGTEVNRTEVGR